MSIPRTTHQWLENFYNVLEGKGNASLSLGSSTGIIGLYGSSGLARQLASGTAGITGWTGAGSSTVSQIWFNGGSGAYYNLADVVTALKNVGILKP